MFRRLVPFVFHSVRRRTTTLRLPLLIAPPHCSVSHSVRCYAKKKADTKKAGKHAKLEFDADSTDFSEYLDVDAYKSDLQKQVDLLAEEFMMQFSLRTNIQAFEQLAVSVPDGSLPLNHVANVHLKSPQLVVISVSSPEHMKGVQYALQKSSFNVTPQVQGLIINVPLPKVTREHRESMTKNAKLAFNKCVDRMMKVKEKHQKPWFKEAKIEKSNPDLFAKMQKYSEELVREHKAKAEEMMKAKQHELLQELAT